MMTNQIQKSIFKKYLEIINKEKVREIDVSKLLLEINELYEKDFLTEIDIYRQKIEIILENLNNNLNAIKRKRKIDYIVPKVNEDIIKILKNDIKSTKSFTTDLSDFEEIKKENNLFLSLENVQKVLQNLIIPKRKIYHEDDFEKFTAEQLSKIFGYENIHRQYSVGGFMALKIDVDVGNGQVGIENKIVDNLSATDMQRMIGQLIYYKKRFYNNTLIVFVTSKYPINPRMKELQKFIEEINVTVVFNQAINL